jgi:hypothetical protein
MLLHRHRGVGAALHRGVIADDHAFTARHPANAGDHARAVRIALIHAVRGQRAQLQKRRAGIEQALHPIARQELAALEMLFARPLIAALGGFGGLLPQLGDQRVHGL